MTDSKYPILYSFRRCPYAMRARMALVSCDIKVELREVDLKNKPEHMISISPKATVPVLIKTDGAVLEESLDIIHWAMSVQYPDAWCVLNENQKLLAKSLISENDTEFKEWLDKYKYAQRFPDDSEEYYQQQGELFLNKLNVILIKNKYLVSQKLSYADITIAPFIRQFANVNFEWFCESRYSRLVEWLDSILNSDIFLTAMQKYPVWKADDEILFFP